ncbi:DUF2341 domain-containing protein [Chloroflexota bacterium]
MVRKCIEAISLVVLLAIAAANMAPVVVQASPDWYDTNWQYRNKITINGDNVTAALTNFPVFVSLTNNTDLGSKAQLDGDDILFTASNGATKLSHEIEKYSSNGVSANLTAWIKIPSLSSPANTDIYMYYGYGTAGSQQDTANVWDSNFKMVQHLEETAGGVNTITDSTSYGNHGTDGNTPTFNVAGKMDGAISFTSASSEYIQLPASNTILNADGFTLETWFITATNHPAYGAEGRLVNLHRGATVGSAVSLYVVQDQIALFYYEGITSHYLTYTVNYYDSVPHHIAATHSSSDNTYRLYYDGFLVASESNVFVGFGTYPAFLATHNYTERFFNGTLDEVRISNSVRSVDWIKTSYNNQNNPSTFYTLGTEENKPVAPTPPPIAVGATVYPVHKLYVMVSWLGLVLLRLLPLTVAGFMLFLLRPRVRSRIDKS